MAKSNDTLILNADGSPLSVLPLSTMSWTDAVKLYYLDRVSIIETYEFWKARSPSLTLAVPSVIMMREYSKPPSAVKFSRKNVYLRDNFTCQYCGEQHLDYMHHLTLDHVVPKAKGGKTNWTNIVAACMACNSKKADHVKGWKPITVPIKPDYFAIANKVKSQPIIVPDEAWLPYLNWDPDLVILKVPRANRPSSHNN